jgi:hypothetical protein
MSISMKKRGSSKGDVQIFKNGKNLVLYPIFLECSKYTSDEFWKNMFEHMSYGKCPSCIYISNNTIYSSNKKKSFSFIIPSDKGANDVFSELKDILMKNTSLCSAADTKAKREKILSKVNKDEITDETSWTEIRKKNLKEIFIIKFVIRMKSRHKISWDVARELYSIIQIGLLTKTQTSKDVKFSSKRIQSIDGIEFDGEGSFINHFSNNEIPKDNDDSDDNNNYLYYYWDKYVSVVSKLA